MSLELRAKVLADVSWERDLQEKKWGTQDHESVTWMSILGEEYGEACQEANRVFFSSNSHVNLRAELVQVAAVAVAAIEHLDRIDEFWKTHGTDTPGS
jgi:hypothetical protein